MGTIQDVEWGHDVLRMRNLRNIAFGHIATVKMTTQDFSIYAKELHDVLSRVDSCHNGSYQKHSHSSIGSYVQKMTDLLNTNIDAEVMKHYVDQLDKMNKEIGVMKQKVAEVDMLKPRVDAMEKEVKEELKPKVAEIDTMKPRLDDVEKDIKEELKPKVAEINKMKPRLDD